jgi:HlyD family secretion protein
MPLRDFYENNKRTVIIASLVVLGLIAFQIYRSRPKDPKFTSVTVKRGDISATVQATGTINPLTTVPVGSYVSGTVQYIFADFNTRVHSGQVLAQLDPAIYHAQVIQARGNLDNAKANLVTLQATVEVDQANVAKSKASLAYQKATAKRSQDLFTSGVVSADANDLTQSTMGQAQADLNSQQAALNQAKAQLAQASTQVTAMEGALKQAETSLKYTTILAPINGVVIARNIDVGQSVAASLQAPNVFTVAQDLTRMQVYASTDESDTGNIKVGTPVTFQVDAFPTELFHGRVSSLRLNATTVQNVVTYNTVIDFDNPDQKLLPGETAYVTIPTGHVTGVILIPNAALSFTPDMPRQALQDLFKRYNIPREATTTHLGGWQVVWKFGPDGKPIPLAVRCGITDFNNTQLLEGNLNEGDVLITAQQNPGGSPASQRAPGLGGPNQPRR